MTNDLTVTNPVTTPAQADSSAQVIRMWLHGRTENTRQAYEADIRECLSFVGTTDLRQITIGMLQRYADHIQTKSPATQARKLASIKSLLSYAHEIGWCERFNVGKAIRLPKLENKLAERIVSEDDVVRMLALETDPRNHAILSVLYHGGLRVSEVAGLQWRHVVPRENGGAQITVHGKGGKTRFVRIGAKLAAELGRLEPECSMPDAPVFVSREGGHLDPLSIQRVVRKAGERIGLDEITPHWLRHAHASHSLDNKAPIHLVQQTLGHASLATTSKYAHARPNESSGTYLVGGK